MNEERVYKYSLALPIVLPVICLLIAPLTPSNLDTVYGPIARVLMAFILSGVIGGIPYAILAIGLLVWMRDKDLIQIRKALLLSPLFLIPIVLFGGLIFIAVGLNVSASYPLVYVYYMLVFSACTLAFGYFYVLIVFGLARLIRKRPFGYNMESASRT